MKFNQLTNSNPLLQEKMNFVVDYFSFTNEYLGKLPEIPFENCLSILNKIFFQIQENERKNSKYLTNYFNQLFEFYKPSFVGKTNNYSIVKAQYYQMIAFKKGPESKNDDRSSETIWIERNQDFIINIERLIEEEKIAFESSIECLYKVIIFNAPLPKEHIELIKFCVHSIVSKFRIDGHSKELVESFTKRILSKDLFPFPQEILESPKDELNTKKQSFLETRDFQKQFDGLRNFVSLFNFNKGFFIFLVNNCLLEDSLSNHFIAQIDKVTFISSDHSSLNSLRILFKKKERIRKPTVYSTFFNKNVLLAYIELNYIDEKDTMKAGLKFVKTELTQFNSYLNRNLSIDETNYIFSQDLSSGYANGRIEIIKNNVVLIQDLDLELVKNNPFEKLRNIESNSKNKLLQNERTFVKAVANNDISTFWIYVESLFSNTKFANPKKQQEVVQHVLVKYFANLKYNVLALVIETLYYSEALSDYTGLTEEEIKHIYDEIHNNDEFKPDFDLYKKKTKAPILKELFKYLDKFNTPHQKTKWENFYNSILLELYEYRNTELHNGIVYPAMQYKLITLIPTMINTLRWALIHGSIKHPELNFKELVTELSK